MLQLRNIDKILNLRHWYIPPLRILTWRQAYQAGWMILAMADVHESHPVCCVDATLIRLPADFENPLCTSKHSFVDTLIDHVHDTEMGLFLLYRDLCD